MCGSKSNKIKSAYCLLIPLQIAESRLAFNNEIATVTSTSRACSENIKSWIRIAHWVWLLQSHCIRRGANLKLFVIRVLTVRLQTNTSMRPTQQKVERPFFTKATQTGNKKNFKESWGQIFHNCLEVLQGQRRNNVFFHTLEVMTETFRGKLGLKYHNWGRLRAEPTICAITNLCDHYGWSKPRASLIFPTISKHYKNLPAKKALRLNTN